MAFTDCGMSTANKLTPRELWKVKDVFQFHLKVVYIALESHIPAAGSSSFVETYTNFPIALFHFENVSSSKSRELQSICFNLNTGPTEVTNRS
jgi:hypothetical protein